MYNTPPSHEDIHVPYNWHVHTQTFMMELLPPEAKTYRHTTHCVVNASDSHPQVISRTINVSYFLAFVSVLLYVYMYLQELQLLLSGTAEVSPIILENQVGKVRCLHSCASSLSVSITCTHLWLV